LNPKTEIEPRNTRLSECTKQVWKSFPQPLHDPCTWFNFCFRDYFRIVADCIHPNPARAGLAGGDGGNLADYKWSSLGATRDGSSGISGINRRGLLIPVQETIRRAVAEIPVDVLIDGEAAGGPGRIRPTVFKKVGRGGLAAPTSPRGRDEKNRYGK